MKTRELGKTGIMLSEIGFGCASVWGKDFFSEEDAASLFFSAYENGITYFDTGFSYGKAEIRLGNCLRQLGAEKRKNVVIATKCGTRIDDNGKYYHDWNIDWLKKSVEISLERLGTDYIDMLHLHGPVISEIDDGILGFLDDMKSRGIAKSVGINSFDTDVLEYVCENKLFDFVMLDYNIMRQDREGLISRLADCGIGVIAGAALAQSLYSNRVFKITSKKDIWYLLRAIKNFNGHLLEGRNYRFMNKCDNMTGNQLALRYVLDNKNISSAVFGTTSIEHLTENVKASEMTMDGEIYKKIVKAGKKSAGAKLDRK